LVIRSTLWCLSTVACYFFECHLVNATLAKLAISLIWL
jgi:hypothetical protein